MKKVIKSFIILLITAKGYSQQVEVGVSAFAGFTMVDVESAMEKVLTDWDQFCYGGVFYGFYNYRENLAIGFEAGFQRLYYWEEYYDYGWGGYYRWGDINTIHFGPVAELGKNNLYLQGGLNIRIFTNGSGISPGLLIGGGYKFALSDRIILPVGFRTDVIFGSATPVAFNLSVGIRYKMNE
ncbi:MAG: hypothetical protein JXB00_00775 [Bacteroidales bacterium]|nr:hypothetical protein [Bacteroidales bacterium]